MHNKAINLDAGENPFLPLQASNPEEYRKHVENGRRVYYRNCVFCHGDNMAGNGMFVHGLDPIPTNFADPGTIAMLRDSFLFWRNTKGGPGLPEEGGPWDSAMPAWEKLLKEDEIWEGDSLPLRFHRPEASRQGGGPQAMTSRLVFRLHLALLQPGVGAFDPPYRLRVPEQRCAQAGDRGNRRAAGVGQAALRQVLLAVPRRQGRRRGPCHLAPEAQAARFHDRQVPRFQDDSQRGAPDTSGPGEHHPAWHAVYLDARLAHALQLAGINLAYFLTTFSPEFAKPETWPRGRTAPGRAEDQPTRPSSSGRSSTWIVAA